MAARLVKKVSSQPLQEYSKVMLASPQKAAMTTDDESGASIPT